MDTCYICDENLCILGDILCQKCKDIELLYQSSKNKNCVFCGKKATEIYLNCDECDNMLDICSSDECMYKAYKLQCKCQNTDSEMMFNMSP